MEVKLINYNLRGWNESTLQEIELYQWCYFGAIESKVDRITNSKSIAPGNTFVTPLLT